MMVADLVGAVVAAFLKDALASGGQGSGRFTLNLSAEQTAAVGHAVLADPALSAAVDLKLPESYVGGFGLPPEALTRLSATYFRSAACEKQIYLLVEVAHEEGASLNEVERIGPAELLDRVDLWLRVVSPGLSLTDEHMRWWEKALNGLRDLRVASLDRFANYVLATRAAVESEGLPLIFALAWAMPALRLPRDPAYFNSVKERLRTQASAWRRQFEAARKQRAGLLLKQSANQLLLSEDELTLAFAKVRDVIPEIYHPAILGFITAPSGWNAQAEALAECDWEHVKLLFNGLQREKFNLGRETLRFFDELEAGRLTDDEREQLQALESAPGRDSDEADLRFYEDHRTELKDDGKLKSAWDRFVYGKAIESTDFIAAIAAAMEPLINRSPGEGTRRLRIRCDRATKRDLRDLNVEAGLYFAHRYAGLDRGLGPRVTWDVGELFRFPELVEAWRAAGRGALNRSSSRTALQLKFVLELETEVLSTVQTSSVQVVWRFTQNAVSAQLVEDWGRLTKQPLTAGRATREASGAQVTPGSVDLSNVKTFVPTYDRDRGSFIPVPRPELDLGRRWRANLAEARAQRLVADAAGDALEAAFARFETAYSAAIRGFSEGGAGGAANRDQVEAYGELLECAQTHAPGDRNRERLLRPMLEIGVAAVADGPPAAVVAPWHPLRLAALWRKARLLIDLVDRVLSSEVAPNSDTRLYFRDLQEDLAHPLYPELVVAWSEDTPHLLSVTDTLQDYSLFEAPIRGTDAQNVSDNPAEGAACVLDLMGRYLKLHPHERDNMSVVLFNCDSARLPKAVVEKIGALHEDDDEVRCQVLLRHVEVERLRQVYQAVLDDSPDVDAYSASEATQDFMARLRISVIADQTAPPDPRDGCPFDIVFSQDVISRHARLEWDDLPAAPADLGELLPSRWSRRRPAAADDLKSAAYLACPVQSGPGWAYLDAVASIFRGDRAADAAGRRLPMRQLDFRDTETGRIFRDTHNLGAWVVNFDELLDRRQLLNQDVRVIRYKQSATQGRNVIISSRAPLSLLRAMILRRLEELHLGLAEEQVAELAERLIQDANDVSGDIVLRAARRGESASELIGVVLSRALLRDELGRDAPCGWYFLDDYANWMGQREEQLADLLAIRPELTAEGHLRVRLALTEAKYVGLDQLSTKRRESLKQLRDTLRRLDDALFTTPEPLERQAWLSRLGDLLLDGIRLPAASGIDLREWRRAVREGRCEFELSGVSHVFVPTATDAPDPTYVGEAPDAPNGYQEIYGRAALKRLLMAYWRGEDTRAIRIELGADHLRSAPRWRPPGSGGAQHMPGPSSAPAEARDHHQPTLAVATASVEPQEVGQTSGPETPTATNTAAVDLSERPPSPQGFAYDAVAALLDTGPALVIDGGAEDWLGRVGVAMRSALQQLKMQAKLVDSRLTPNSALLRFAGSANLTMDQVNRKRVELLTTHGLNVISVRPEPGAVVIAVERPNRALVDIRALWRSWHPEPGPWGNQDLLIGIRENDGKPLFLSPGGANAPHTLIAGSTGSGKSVLMQNIILGIAATNRPDEARIILIDPKQGVDYFMFEDLPHLDGGLIDDQATAQARLEALVQEMDRRYTLFKAAKTPNLAAYNLKSNPDKGLPVIWLIHDEFAEWMLTDEYRQEVSSTVQRLGVKARAAGIYLVFAAQRPEVGVMPMQLRANLGNRLILRVDSEGTSEIALGDVGAERLLGRGHLLAKLEGERDLIYAQVPAVDASFATALVAAIAAKTPRGRAA